MHDLRMIMRMVLGMHRAAACPAHCAVRVNLAFGAVLRGNSHRERGRRRSSGSRGPEFSGRCCFGLPRRVVAHIAAGSRQCRIFASLAARECPYLKTDHGATDVAAPAFLFFPVIASGVARGMDLLVRSSCDSVCSS
ncbi:hypothetical protein ACFJIW_15985 [Tahibacter sp. UC22_41]|uniref:hypothetical protein n=1 Tax=Tahibacter sp. UC22_41 TaxID=3350178 RepID=UPI0036DED516